MNDRVASTDNTENSETDDAPGEGSAPSQNPAEEAPAPAAGVDDTANSGEAGWLTRNVNGVFIAALMVGGGLLLLAWLVPSRHTAFDFLAFVVGLAIMLAAFGTVAGVRDGKFAIGGAGAVALILGAAMHQMGFSNTSGGQDYATLQIDNIPDGSTVDFGGRLPFYGADLGRNIFEFVAKAESLSAPDVRMNMTIPIEGADCQSEQCEKEVIFSCISKKPIVEMIGTEGQLEWRYQLHDGIDVLVDTKLDQVVGSIEGCNTTAQVRPAVPGPANGQTWNLISPAHAQTPPPSVDVLLKQIQSSSTAKRRTSRALLARHGPAMVKPAMVALSRSKVSYRTRLGIVVGLAGMMAKNKDKRKQISADITDPQLARLIEGATHKDRTIRVYTGEFLYDLGDPRSVALALAKMPSASDDGKYNLLLIIKGAIGQLPQDHRRQVEARLDSIRPGVGPKTQNLLDTIPRVAQTANRPMYQVVVGSYLNEASAKRAADRINAENQALKAHIAKRLPGNAFYPVIVGDRLPLADAKALMNRALQAKTVSEAYLSNRAR